MVLLIPAVVLLAAAVPPPRRDGTTPLAASLVAFALASVAAGEAPALIAVVLLFATALIVVVAAFSRRHLDGDLRRARYDRLLLVTSGAALVSLAAGDLALITTGWVLTGWGVTALVGHHQEIPATDTAVAALRRSRLVGDAALVTAVACLTAAAGGTGLDDVLAWVRAHPGSPLLPLAGVALLVASAARCGLLPFSRWIPLSVVAPTPVSALLHAGIVNAPVVLLLRLAPIWTPSAGLRWATVALGMLTAAATFPRLLVRTDVKTRLAWSTTAQLGFVVALIGAGALAVAVLHLLLHGVYKATAFLRAGDQISRARHDPLPATSRRTRVLGAAGGTLTATALLMADGAQHHPMTAAAVLVGGTAAGYGLMSLQARTASRIAAAAVATAAAAATLAGARLVSAGLGLPLVADGAQAWAAAGVVICLSLAFLAVRMFWPSTPAVWAFLHRAADPTVPLIDRRLPRRIPAPDGVPARPDRHARLRSEVHIAAAQVPPSWGWQSFIATNPLLGLQDRGFADAVTAVAKRGWSPLPGMASSPATPGDVVDDLVSGWLAAYTGLADTPWPAPSRDLDLWTWFRAVACADPALPAPARRWLARMRADALDVVASGVPAPDGLSEGAWYEVAAGWARQELLRLPGWAGYLGRRGTGAAALDTDALVDLLAVRTATRMALAIPAVLDRPVTSAQEAAVAAGAALDRLGRQEDAVRAHLLAGLAAGGRSPQAGVATRHDADVVFCIDARSEPLRRHLEARGAYRTIGFAGFFGMPVARIAGGSRGDRLPVLLRPTAAVTEAVPAGAGTPTLIAAALRCALDTPGGGFAAVDVASIRGLMYAATTVLPALRRIPAVVARPLELDLTGQPQLVEAAVGMVRATGLHGAATARLVGLVGHGSTSTNNPAESAFDCGACGGSRGAFNAHVAARVLNSHAGRAALAAAGLDVPADTWFVAAEHDTALDRVVLLGAQDVPASHVDDLARLTADLGGAATDTATERCRALPGAGRGRSAARAVRRRGLDGSEVRHEWGLAGNAFFVAAPRRLTAGLDLRGRAFLHEYDHAADPDGVLLEAILTAPLVVAHWINAQYLFSAADPHHLGAGSKTAHNPVGALGVLSGPGGDLRTGLAEQSVRFLGAPVHGPGRLLAVVAAPPECIDAVLEGHPALGGLITGGWLAMCSVHPADGRQQVRAPHGWVAPPAHGSQAVPQRTSASVR